MHPQPANNQGTGLGLAITKKLVANMGGQIQLISEQGVGSEFIVLIRVEPAGPQAEPGIEPVSPEALRGKKVLIVDDNSIACSVTEYYCRQAGMEVLAILPSAGEATDWLSRNAVVPDLILTDVVVASVRQGILPVRSERTPNTSRRNWRRWCRIPDPERPL